MTISMETKNYINEEWKPIKGYEGLYEISNYGRVKSLERIIPMPQGMKNSQLRKIKSKLRKQCIRGMYKCVHLYKDGKCEKYSVHRLVATAFIPNPNNYPCVNHKDENKLNNHVDNLEWCSYGYNNSYGNGYVQRKNTKKGKPIEKLYKPIICVETNRKFNSIKEACLFLNKKQNGHIGDCCNNKRNTAYGYHWKWAA